MSGRVVTSGQTAPLREVVEAAFDDVASAVVDWIEYRWAAAVGPSAFAVSGLVGGFGDHGGDAAGSQVLADRSRGIRFVASNPVRACACSTATEPWDSQVAHQMGDHWCVAGLLRPDQHNHGPPMAVDGVMDLGGPATAGATDRVVRRLDPQIRVVRPSPCGPGDVRGVRAVADDLDMAPPNRG